MNAAETLRRAAALMRERAEAATPGPWTYLYPDQCCPDGCVQSPDDSHVDDNPGTDADAEHIASWHPTVALAVADLLDQAAKTADLVESPKDGTHPPFTTKALAVARAYLGEEATP